MKYSPTLSATFLTEMFIVSHLDYCSDPNWSTCHCSSPSWSTYSIAVNFLWKKEIRSCQNLLRQKSKDRFIFLKDKFQNLYHDIQGPRKSCSISSFISSQSTCTPVTPGDHTFFNHATHFNKSLYLSLLVPMFGMPFHTSSARPKLLTIIIKHHCHFRSHRFPLCVPMVLCSSCHPTTDFT